ncbi:DUF3794 domain-containing protein [Clostridium folliculivorans]|uniref:SipL SPOCS domain-containing protein n=1 Tax=Clostridium folliculivorans TaxID=2886038 RepID=A0A9W6DBB7_9CLOT|nr:DUF3794 domain-containing protein [Clostridium folliculivorans]GKU25548.1 hypothetical protein CFOLD11_23740 [Clostridium folliculivorans]GKU28571.1 hypothetical protein CFB3_06770 [Clostridium folliculivorans]
MNNRFLAYKQMPTYGKPPYQQYEEKEQYYPMEYKKLLQVPVIVGFGDTQELVVKESIISPPSPPVFRIVKVDTEVIITNTQLVPRIMHQEKKCDGKWWAKVIIDGFIDKNVLYKTIEDFTCDSVNGPVFQFTTRFPFATFVEVEAKEPIKETDSVEILKAFVEGSKEELLDPNPVPMGAPEWAVTYNRLLEKLIVRIDLKVTRMEHVPVTIEEHKKECKPY